jgi:hypothetical protein
MNSNQLAIIIAFYLSKFDKIAKNRLGYKTDSDAFQGISDALGIKKNYIKFRRDEFDPIHPWRKGWLRPMDTRIVRAIEALQDLTESELGEIVERIIGDVEYRNGEEITRISQLFAEETKEKKQKKSTHILRGPTGKKAEEYFIEYHNRGKNVFEGQLIDMREMGCGYDFEIVGKNSVCIEVKGLAKTEGGILFTSKEWNTAKNLKDRYILALIKNLDQNPEIELIQNPATKLNAKKSIITTVQIQWNVSSKEFQK